MNIKVNLFVLHMHVQIGGTTNEPYYRQTTLPDLQKRKPSAYRQKKKYLICYIHHIVNRKIYDCLTLLAIHVPAGRSKYDSLITLNKLHLPVKGFCSALLLKMRTEWIRNLDLGK